MAGITLVIEVDDKGSIKVKQFADESKKAFKEMTDGPKAAQGPLDSLREGWVALTAKVAAATAVVYGVSKVLSSFVNEAAEAEQIENRLKFALETTGYTWQYAKIAVDQFANSVQEMTRFSDEQARQALTDMMMYTRDFAKAQMGAKLAMDMSIRTGQDLGSTSRLIGMAMSGNVEMLGRYIPELRTLKDRLGENATVAQLWNETLKILQQKFGGTAQADVKSYSGTLAQFKNAWSDFKKEIGMGLLPILKETFEWFTKIFSSFKTFSPETASQPLFDATINKYKARAEELKNILAQPGLVPAQKDMITNQITALEEGIRRLEGARQKGIKDKGILAGETKKDDLRSPFERLYGMTESELKDRLSTSNLLYQGWLEERKREGDLFLADQQTLMDSLLATRTGAEFTFPTEDILPDLLQIENKEGEILTLTKEQYEIRKNMALEAAELLATIRQLSGQWSGAEFTFPTEDILPDWLSTKKGPQLVERWKNQMTDMQTSVEGAVKGIADVWSSSFSTMRRSQQSFSEWFKGTWLDMADYAIGQIQKMLMNYALFGSISGKTGGSSFFGSSSGGYGGLIGGILGAIGLQEGGQFWVDRPTPLIVGEKGREFVSVTPEGKMGLRPRRAYGPEGRGGQNITNISYLVMANDVQSFDQALRRSGATIVKINTDDIRSFGLLRNAVKKA